MNAAISLAELLAWSEEASAFWKTHLDANPALLDLPCGIGGTADVRGFVRHIWSVELVWAQRLGALPVTARKDFPEGPLAVLYDLHIKAAKIYRALFASPAEDWNAPFLIDWMPFPARNVSRRKMAAHALLHTHRHLAQLATLVRTAGFPSGFHGDLLVSQALE